MHTTYTFVILGVDGPMVEQVPAVVDLLTRCEVFFFGHQQDQEEAQQDFVPVAWSTINNSPLGMSLGIPSLMYLSMTGEVLALQKLWYW